MRRERKRAKNEMVSLGMMKNINMFKMVKNMINIDNDDKKDEESGEEEDDD